MWVRMMPYGFMCICMHMSWLYYVYVISIIIFPTGHMVTVNRLGIREKINWGLNEERYVRLNRAALH